MLDEKTGGTFYLGHDDGTSDGKPDYLISAAKSSSFPSKENLKRSKDGRHVLVPQPSTHPNDPLNWSDRKKYITIFTITLIGCLTDFGSAVGIPAVLVQAEQWHLSPDTVQHSLSGNIFCLGAGGFIAIQLSEYFGRLPILLLFHSLGLATGVWSGAATTFNSYLAARILNGFFSGVAQSGGLMWIKEIFFSHQHPKIINMWAGPLILAPFIGPMIAAFMLTTLSWRWPFWLYTILNLVALVLVVFFLDEPIYNRSIPADRQPSFGSRWQRLLGITQWRTRYTRPGFWSCMTRPFVILTKLPLLAVLFYGFFNYAFVIGVNTTSSIWLMTLYNFTPLQIGYFYFSALVGVVVAAGLGHWAHDAVGNFFARRNGGIIEPEFRLVLVHPGSALQIASLVILGFTLQYHWHYILIAVFFGAQLCGLNIAIAGISAFIVDAYPEVPGETGAWLIVVRTFGGFMISYVQLPWIAKRGATEVLGVQAALAGLTAVIIVALSIWGKRLRVKQGPVVVQKHS